MLDTGHCELRHRQRRHSFTAHVHFWKSLVFEICNTRANLSVAAELISPRCADDTCTDSFLLDHTGTVQAFWGDGKCWRSLFARLPQRPCLLAGAHTEPCLCLNPTVEEVQGLSAAHVSDHSARGQGSAVLPWKTWGRIWQAERRGWDEKQWDSKNRLMDLCGWVKN